QGDCHRTLVVWQRAAVGREQPPRSAPITASELWTAAPEVYSRLIEIRQLTSGVGRVDGRRQSVQQVGTEGKISGLLRHQNSMHPTIGIILRAILRRGAPDAAKADQ